MSKCCALILWFVLQLSLSAQSPQDSCVKLYAPNGAQGTAFAVKKLEKSQLFATAAHVVAVDRNDISRYFSGQVYRLVDANNVELAKGYVVTVDTKNDFAIVSAPVNLPVVSLEELPATALGLTWTPGRTPITVMGFAAGNWLKTHGFFSLATEDTIYADCIAVPGQSGGPVVVDGKVVGVISGGHRWYPYETKESKGNVTWPSQCGSVQQLKKLIERAGK